MMKYQQCAGLWQFSSSKHLKKKTKQVRERLSRTRLLDWAVVLGHFCMPHQPSAMISETMIKWYLYAAKA